MWSFPANPTLSLLPDPFSNIAGKPGGLTLCVLLCLPTLLAPGDTARGANTFGTDKVGLWPHPPPTKELSFPSFAGGLNDLFADDGEGPQSGKREGGGSCALGMGLGEPEEIEVDRGRPRVMGGRRGGRVEVEGSGLISIGSEEQRRGLVYSISVIQGDSWSVTGPWKIYQHQNP